MTYMIDQSKNSQLPQTPNGPLTIIQETAASIGAKLIVGALLWFLISHLATAKYAIEPFYLTGARDAFIVVISLEIATKLWKAGKALYRN